MKSENLKIQVLLAVWGAKFIESFLEFSLPSLLAPGNLPALAANADTRFIFLSRKNDSVFFEKNAAFKYLKSICPVEFVEINDLIVIGNYSTTLTYAFDRAIKRNGSEMLNTHFVFLTADYIMADESMLGLLRYIRKGYTGICAGNFQVTEEAIKPFLLKRRDINKHVIQVRPRVLVKKCLHNLHPISYASLCDQSFLHNYRANRFFFRANDSVMGGRFYLLHMLCIKPEVLNYTIGASCDYSFIPEMCPSGNVAVITDSDDYLVIEAQPKDHEMKFVDVGAYNLAKVAHALAEWTTENHRQNSLHTIYYHTRDITEHDKKDTEETLGSFIRNINSRLVKYTPKSYRSHPYWVGAKRAFDRQRDLLRDRLDYEYPVMDAVNEVTLAKRLYYIIFGFSPIVYRWHFRWAEYNRTISTIKEYVDGYDVKKIVVLYDTIYVDFLRYRKFLSDKYHINNHYNIQLIMQDEFEIVNKYEKKFSLCFLMLSTGNLKKLKRTLSLANKFLAENGKICVFVPNQHNELSSLFYNFSVEVCQRMSSVIYPGYKMKKIVSINNFLTNLGFNFAFRIDRTFSYSRKLRILAYAVIGVFGSCISLILNLMPKMIRNRGHCAGLFFELDPLKRNEVIDDNVAVPNR